MQWNLKGKLGRKRSGGKYNKSSKKKRHQRGRDFIPTGIGAPRLIKQRTRGDNAKVLVVRAQTANITIGKEVKKAKILTVKDNTANSQFIRRNIITKGAIIETDLGKARVTSRPGQNGSVDAVLVEEKSQTSNASKS